MISHIELTPRLKALLANPNTDGGIASIISRSALLGLYNIHVVCLSPVVQLWVDYYTIPRPIIIAPVGRIDNSGLFMLDNNQLELLNNLQSQSRKPGVLVLYGDAKSSSPIIETSEFRSNITALYRRLSLFEDLKLHSIAHAGNIYHEPKDCIEADGVFLRFLQAVPREVNSA